MENSTKKPNNTMKTVLIVLAVLAVLCICCSLGVVGFTYMGASSMATAYNKSDASKTIRGFCTLDESKGVTNEALQYVSSNLTSKYTAAEFTKFYTQNSDVLKNCAQPLGEISVNDIFTGKSVNYENSNGAEKYTVSSNIKNKKVTFTLVKNGEAWEIDDIKVEFAGLDYMPAPN